MGVAVTSTMASLSCSLSLLLVVMVAGSLANPSGSTNITLPPFHGPEPRVQYDESCQCGQKTLNRIVGGEETTPNEYPWMAGLFYRGIQQFCGGSLINDRYVLTAAHCVYDMRASDLSVRLGDHDISTSSETNHVTRSVSEIINHPRYQARTQKNDIALLKLSSPVTISSTVLPVCLPPQGSRYTGSKATVTGWGTLSSGGSSPDELQEVEVTVLSNIACRRSYG